MLLCEHFTISNLMSDCFLSLCTIYIGVKHLVCQLCSLCCLFSELGFMQPLTFPLFPFLAFSLPTKTSFFVFPPPKTPSSASLRSLSLLFSTYYFRLFVSISTQSSVLIIPFRTFALGMQSL